MIINIIVLLCLCLLLSSCSSGGVHATLKEEVYKVYDVRTLAIDADTDLAYLPPIHAWLGKYRPPCPTLTGDIYLHSVLGFTQLEPNIKDVYSDIDWHDWKWYVVNEGYVYYFDEPLPANCTSGNSDIEILEIDSDETGTYLILKIRYYTE